jgi:glyoxylase-like metal-dependent hydrolase (beta-lactamase superfamily II)
MPVRVESFFDAPSATFTHLVFEPGQSACAVIDAVLGFDPKSGRTDTRAADEVVGFVRDHGLDVQWLLETHAHADHISGAAYLRRRLGGRIAISAAIRDVRTAFGEVFDAERAERFDHLFAPDERFRIGNLTACALPVPGHTPADVAYQVEEDCVFVGDTLFAPDVGTARCDFPGGSATQLYRSIRRLLALPGHTRLFMCHDYPPEGRAPRAEWTVAEQRAGNVHVRDGIDEAAFVELRNRRDASLAMPVLFIPSIQLNLAAGELPAAERNGVRYLKVPLDHF